ncbi:hypothetical protein [Streptomyces sp. NPDC001761]
MTRTGSLLWPAVVEAPVVLSRGGTALGQGEDTPRAASRAAAARAGSAVSSDPAAVHLCQDGDAEE